MRGIQTVSPLTQEALRLLGQRIELARRGRGYTIAEMAERVGVSHVTMRNIEKGDLRVAVGAVFEAATLLGVPLFDPDPEVRRLEGERVRAELALLPASTRPPEVKIDDAF